LATVEIGMMHWQGLTQLTGASYTPIGLVNADPAGIQVRADSPYKNVNDLLAAIKANPGKFKASGTGQGGIWHLAIAGLLLDQKIDPAALPWVPSNGAAPGLQDMVAGGVEVAPVSLPEARSLIDAGKVRSLAIMDAKPSTLYPNVPTLKSATGSNWTMAAWRGVLAPKGLPAPIQTKLAEAVRKAFAGAWTAVPDVQWTKGKHFVHGDLGVSEWTFEGTAADGSRIETDGVDLFTFKDGKILVKNVFRKARPNIPAPK
jgi:tripartite-type tricarboxylate transporter receptor subunit TctC